MDFASSWERSRPSSSKTEGVSQSVVILRKIVPEKSGSLHTTQDAKI